MAVLAYAAEAAVEMKDANTASNNSAAKSAATSNSVDIILVSASASGKTNPEWVLDGHITETSRWAAKSGADADPWLQIELSRAMQIKEIKMAFYRGNQRRMLFDVLTSVDGKKWQKAYAGKSSGLTKELESFKFTSRLATSIRIVGHGNTENIWNSISEVSIPGANKSAFATKSPPKPWSTANTSASDIPSPAVGDFTVSSKKELLAALDSAVSGDVIVLKNGNYNNLKIDRSFSDYVVLRSRHHLGAIFDKIEISGDYGYLHLDGIKARSIRVTAGAHHIKVSRSKFTSTAYFKNARNILIEKNEITAKGATHALILNHISNFKVTNNYIAHAQEDLLRLTGYSANGVVQDNTLYDAMPKNKPTSSDLCAYQHSDAIQLFGADDTNPTNITIRGNHIYDDPLTNEVRPKHCVDGKQGVRLTMQGIFVSDPKSKGYQDILIEENLLYLGTPNSIYINGGSKNLVVRNNTLLPWPGSSGGTIRIVEKSRKSNKGLHISRNVVSDIRNETTKLSNGMKVLKNFVYETADKSSPNHVSKLFKGAGQGSQWHHFVPADGGKIAPDAGYGALTRLEGLIQARNAPQPF